jgi:hypothetical protein
VFRSMETDLNRERIAPRSSSGHVLERTPFDGQWSHPGFNYCKESSGFLHFTLFEKAHGTVKSLLKAVELKPDHVGAPLNLSHALESKGDLSGAVAEARKVIELEPD